MTSDAQQHSGRTPCGGCVLALCGGCAGFPVPGAHREGEWVPGRALVVMPGLAAGKGLCGVRGAGSGAGGWARWAARSEPEHYGYADADRRGQVK